MAYRFQLGNLRFRTWSGVAALVGVISIAVMLCTNVPLTAQVQSGIDGTITDSTNAVIPGANVTITNTATGVVAHAVTSSAGTFTVIGLIPGNYSVSVAAPGFHTATTTATVEVARMSTADFTMQPGATNQTVNVAASSISLNTTSPVIGTTLEPELVKNAPIEINGLARQIDAFMYLAPGVQGSAAYHNINGGAVFENEVQFNGVPVAFVQFEGNQTYLNPPYEAIDEFRVNSSTFDPEFGLGQGAVTYNMASGTNDLHGDAFEILRNQLFDSAGFFPTRYSPDGHPTAPINQENNYGFTVGGPVTLPKVYHGRNRTFFHLSVDWFRQNQAQTAIGTVPTPAMKNGDFSHFVDTSGNQIPIYDPTTGQPFPGNIIPASRFSAISKSILPLIPNPDRPGVVSGLVSNKTPTVTSIPIRQTIWAYTIDHTLTSSQTIHWSQWRDDFTSPTFTGAPIVPASNELENQINNKNLGSGFLLNYVKTINPNLVMTAGADWVGLILSQNNANQNVSFPGVQNGTTFPVVTFDGQNAPTAWGVAGNSFLECCEGSLTNNNNRTLGIVGVNNWMWVKGRHTFNFGGQIRHTWQNTVNCVFCSGTMNFSQKTTSTPDSNSQYFGSYGSSFASFLLGQVDAAERIFTQEMYMRNKAFAFYAQDEFRASPRLTFNVGIRYDILVPFTESHNNIFFVDRTAPDPGAGGLLGAATKFGHCAGCAGITRAPIHWNNWQPRVGFSYQINQKTVIQSGFYLTYLDGGAYEYGTAFSASFMGSLSSGSYLRASTGSNVPGYGSWDTLALPAPQATPFSPSMANAGTIFDFATKKRNPYPELPTSPTVGTAPSDIAWSFRVQRELPANMFLTLAYVANRSIHLPTTFELSNQPNPSVLKYGSLLGENILAPAVVAAGFRPPYPEYVAQFGASATLEQALTPYPQFGGYFPAAELDGTSFYNGFQAQAEKRFTGGVSFLSDFTLSRNMANQQVASTYYSSNGVNAYDPGLQWGPSQIDQKYLINNVGTYALPFGHGKRFMGSAGGLMNELVGGWQVSAILTYQGGYPLAVSNNYNPLLVNGSDRPNLVPGVRLQTYSYGRSTAFFTGKSATPPVQIPTNAFQNTGPWQVGDMQNTYPALRGAPLRVENFDAIKSFHLGDRVQASLRVDYFNAFNRTQLQNPDTNSLDSTFGQITNLSSQISNRQGQATFRVEF